MSTEGVFVRMVSIAHSFRAVCLGPKISSAVVKTTADAKEERYALSLRKILSMDAKSQAW